MRTIIEEYFGVHDNEIHSYHVDIRNRILQMDTQYYDKGKTRIVFTGVRAHRFENVTYCNIINRISQLSIDCFIDENEAFLEDSLRYAFPIYAESISALKAYLEENELKIFDICSNLGLCGFVIAKDIVIEVVDT